MGWIIQTKSESETIKLHFIEFSRQKLFFSFFSMSEVKINQLRLRMKASPLLNNSMLMFASVDHLTP